MTDRTCYLIRTKYVGPSRWRGTDHSEQGYLEREPEYHVRATPGTTNLGGQPLSSGWLGTTNDSRSDALGAYPTREAAIAAARADWDEQPELALVQCDEDEECDECHDEDAHLVVRVREGWVIAEAGDHYEYDRPTADEIIAAGGADEWAEREEQVALAQQVVVHGLAEYAEAVLQEERAGAGA